MSELEYLQKRVRELESRIQRTSPERDNNTPHVLSPDETESIITLPYAYAAAESPHVMDWVQMPQQDVTATNDNEERNGGAVDGNDDKDYDTQSDKEPRDASDTVIKDAASILEFLAWGRRKDPEYHPDGRMNSTAVPSTAMRTDSSINMLRRYSAVGRDAGPGTTNHPIRPTLLHDANDTDGSGDVGHLSWNGNDGFQGGVGAGNLFGDSGSLQQQPLAVMQLLLPSRRQVEQLVQYHIDCLLWYHASFFAPRFLADVADFYENHDGSIERSTTANTGTAGMDLQWAALLFSVLSGSLTCAPAQQALAWGFREPERHVLCKHWFQASLECLNRDQYMANHSILSCQAIATMTISAHILGFSNTQSIQLAVAVRIAQSLGLHRLGLRGAESLEAEIGRRVWSQLCSQDWFSIPFSESYLVNPLHSESCTLANCDDSDLATPLPENEPTVSGYSRFLNTIASIMPRLQDGLLSCNTAYTRYQQVLSWDSHMRILATANRPLFLSSQVALQPHWPCWIPWARRALAISSGHKIIMIHRSFLSDSFTNPAFSFTRHTCIAASKTIIKEYKAAEREDGPILWVHQAFSVAASIILILDVLYRRPGEELQHAEHKQLVEDVIGILQKFPNSMIAVRGTKLLRALLDEIADPAATAAEDIQDTTSATANPHTSRKRKKPGSDAPPGEDAPVELPLRGHLAAQRTSFNVPAFIRRYCQGGTAGARRHSCRQTPQQRHPSQTTNKRQRLEQEAASQPVSNSTENNVASELVTGDYVPSRSSIASYSHGGPSDPAMGITDTQASFATRSDEQTVMEAPNDHGQLDVSMLLPPGWESTNNGFENLLYLVNHDFTIS